MKKLSIIACLFSLMVSQTSCGDFLEEYSQSKITATEVSHLNEVLLGSVYLPSLDYNGPSAGHCGFLNLLDDDVNTGKCDFSGEGLWTIWNGYVSPLYGYFAWQLEVGKIYESGSVADDDPSFKELYKRINVANVVLDQITDMPHETDEDNALFYRVQAESHFLRAQFYFTLANLYGKAYQPATCATDLCVPLKTTPYTENRKFARATVKEIYDQIVFDLNKAEEFFKISPQEVSRRGYRASMEAVNLLQSRVYLYMQQWQLAEEKARAVVESGHNSLATIDLLTAGEDFLTENNPEVIFSQGTNFLSGEKILNGLLGNYCVTQELYQLYDEKDKRRESFFKIFEKGNGEPADSLGLANKYHREDGYRSHVSDVFGMRVAEAYLNLAEACAMQPGKEVDALKAYNTLRKNRIIDYVDENHSGAELMNNIREERRRELCFEGHRWFDLRRYAVNPTYPFSKKIVHVFNVTNETGFFKLGYVYILNENDDAYTFPIPQSVVKFDEIKENNPRVKRDEVEVITPETEEDNK